MDSTSDRQAERNAARRRIARITQATAGAAALGTCVVAGLAATTPTHATTSSAAQTAVASETTDPAIALTPAESSPEVTDDAPVATSGGS
jgi:hypothetical protein